MIDGNLEITNESYLQNSIKLRSSYKFAAMRAIAVCVLAWACHMAPHVSAGGVARYSIPSVSTDDNIHKQLTAALKAIG